MPLGLATSLGLGAPRSATSSGTIPDSGIAGEQDVIDLGPAAWFDASYSGAITESGGAVSKWTSREGNDIELVQATGSKQPTFTASNSDFDDINYAIIETESALISEVIATY